MKRKIESKNVGGPAPVGAVAAATTTAASAKPAAEATAALAAAHTAVAAHSVLTATAATKKVEAVAAAATARQMHMHCSKVGVDSSSGGQHETIMSPSSPALQSNGNGSATSRKTLQATRSR